MTQNIERIMYIRMKKRKRMFAIAMRALSYFLLITGSFFISVPFIWMMVTSLKDKGTVFSYPPEWIPRSVLTTIYDGKEKNIVTSDKNRELGKFIEIDSKITVPKIQYTKVRKTIKSPYVNCSCKIVKSKKHKVRLSTYGNDNTASFDLNDLKKSDDVSYYLGEKSIVYLLKKDITQGERLYPAGLPVIIRSSNQQAYMVEGDIITLTNFYDDNIDVSVFDPIEREDLSLITLNKTDAGIVGSELAVKIENLTYLGDTWVSRVMKVKASDKIRAEVQYLDQYDKDQLSGSDVLIAYDKSELIQSDQFAQNMEGEDQALYYLESKPTKLFAVNKENPLEWEAYGKVISNVIKQKPLEKTQKIPDNLVEDNERIYANKYYALKKKNNILTVEDRTALQKMMSGLDISQVNKIESKVDAILAEPKVYNTDTFFVNKKEVRLHWENFYKAFFTALPPIENENVKSGFNILKILLMIFGQIPAFVVYFINSLSVAVSTTVLELMTSCLAAYAFARLRWKGRDLVFLGYLSTMMIPYAVTMIPVFVTIKKLGWVDSYKALILPLSFSPMSVFMLRQFFLSIPTSLEEAASLDGSSKLGILWRIILPLSKPALATLMIFKFQFVYNDFMWPLIVTNSDYMKVIQIGLESFQGMHTTEWNLLMAATVIVVLPILAVYIFNQKYINQGIKLGGGIKG